ncbi:MAG: hypothetical protein K0S41_1864 [Anaerocolumna sp.]|nr:hypothetical protein [Anaerocolumna sp.]
MILLNTTKIFNYTYRTTQLDLIRYFNDRKKIVSDSWDVALVYKNKQYEMNYRINNSEVFKELIDKIMTLSPLPVDLHGWS